MLLLNGQIMDLTQHFHQLTRIQVFDKEIFHSFLSKYLKFNSIKVMFNRSIKYQDSENFDINLNFPISEDNFVRLAIQNSIDMSEFSKPVKINKMPSQNMFFQNQTLNKISLITIASLVALGILISCLIIFK